MPSEEEADKKLPLNVMARSLMNVNIAIEDGGACRSADLRKFHPLWSNMFSSIMG